MKLIAMLSFFEGDAEYLEGDVRDLHALGVDVIVACDGSYGMYPDTLPRSSGSLVETLRSTTEELGVSLLLYQPSVPWLCNEVEKRQTMLDLAWSIAEDGDWFVVWDCDYKLIDIPEDRMWAVRRLMLSQDVFATVSFTESSQDNGWHDMQMFIRAQPVMMDGNHHTYRLADGRRSQIIRRPVENEAKALDLGKIKIRHRVYDRDPERRAKQTAWYEVRDRDGLET